MDDNPAQFTMEALYLTFIAYQNPVINKQNQVNAFLTAKDIGVNLNIFTLNIKNITIEFQYLCIWLHESFIFNHNIQNPITLCEKQIKPPFAL